MVSSWDHADLCQFLSTGHLTRELLQLLDGTLTDALPESREYDERDFETSTYTEAAGPHPHLYRVVTRHFSPWYALQLSISARRT
jgi:hypothetical protein